MRLFLSVAAFSIISSAAAAEQVWLTMDQVRPYEIKTEAGQIVVGNPGIADVSVQDKTRLLLFGKAPGQTNIYIFDEDGKTIDNLKIRVKSAGNDMLTFYRGGARVTYNCTTHCEPTITVGDDPSVFEGVTQQSKEKLQQAAASGSN